MIKKIFLISAALIFAFSVLGASVMKTSALTSSKNYKIASQESTSSGKTTADSLVQKSDYFLAYPGILPDNILYSLKMVRDRIRLFFTVDQQRKVDVLLLYADKRIAAAKALMEKGKVDLALETATKAEKYLERTVNQERIAREGGKDTSRQLDNLLQATFKHEEVLLEFESSLGKQTEIEKILGYPKAAREQLLSILNK